MKSTGIVRKVDELGRVVIPIELRRTLGIEEKDEKVLSLIQDVKNNIGNNMEYVDNSSTEPKEVKILGAKKLDNGDELAQVQDINSKEIKDVPTTTLKKKV